jgi:hypothetical protein
LIGNYDPAGGETGSIAVLSEESIKKVIQSIDGYESKAISILAINDFNEIRIAGILADNHPGYIEFKRNKNGDYEWSHIETTSGEATLGFYLPNISEVSSRKIMVVTNQNNQIAKLTVEINKQLFEKLINSIQSSVTWFDLPQTESNEYRFDNYKYYDKNGQLINN